MSTPTVVLQKEIIYFGQRAKTGCDARCTKAWGIMVRPKIELSDDPDDVVYLNDDELDDAPVNPGTYEGGDAKPRHPDQRLNKWCVRQCERNQTSAPGKADEPLVLTDWSRRLYNLPDSAAAKAAQASEDAK